MTEAKPASLAEALAALQAQMPPVGKHAKADAGKYDYKYAPGEAITPVLYPLMSALGLSYSAKPTFAPDTSGYGGRFVLQYTLRHTSGEYDTGDYPLPDPERYGPQDLGKAITYARRYALCALVGLFPGGDDTDANGITEPARKTTVADRRARIEHERIVHDRAGHDPAKVTRTKGQKVSGTAEDPWAADAPVDGPRAAAMRESLSGPDLTDPEDKPGSILPSQLKAVHVLYSKVGITDEDRHQYALDSLKLPTLPPHPETGHPSLSGLSMSQAADLIRGLQADLDLMRADSHAKSQGTDDWHARA